MTRRFLVTGWFLLALPVLTTGCGQGLGLSQTSVSLFADPAVVERLEDRAKALAEDELVRFNKAEQVYATQVMYHPNMTNLFGIDEGVYLKMYREFTGYDIADIVRTESLLRPVAFRIVYHAKVHASKAQHSALPGSLQKALADDVLTVVREITVPREYRGDSRGDVDETQLGQVPPMNFYQMDKPAVGEAMPRTPDQGPEPRS